MLTANKPNKTLPKSILVEGEVRDLRPTFHGWGPRL